MARIDSPAPFCSARGVGIELDGVPVHATARDGWRNRLEDHREGARAATGECNDWLHPTWVLSQTRPLGDPVGAMPGSVCAQPTPLDIDRKRSSVRWLDQTQPLGER